MKKMLISGAYGTGNLGDEYILQQLINIFGKEFSITVLSQDSAYTSSHFPAVRSIPQSPSFLLRALIRDIVYFNLKDLRSRWEFLKEVFTCDIFLLGGGGLLVEMIPRVLRYYIRQLSIAHLLGKKIIIFGVGVGVLKTKSGKRKLANILKKIPYVYVRDGFSLQSLHHLGALHAKQMPDLVYGLFTGVQNKAKSKVIGVNVYRPFVEGTVAGNGEERLSNFEESLGGLLHRLAGLGYHIELFSFGSIYDTQYANELQVRWSGLNASFKHFQHKEEMANYDYTITMRFHAGVTSLMYGIPSLCIDGQNKTERLLREMDLLKMLVPLTDGINRPGKYDLNEEELFKQFEWMTKNEEDIKKRCQTYFTNEKSKLASIEQEVCSFL